MLITLMTLFWISVLAIVYTYLGYPALLGVCHFLVRNHASKRNDEYLPTVSLILAAHNEQRWIQPKLDNCLSIDYPQEQMEILVGSDGSSDNTNQIVREFTDPRIRLLAYAPRRGKMATVNRLVQEAKNEICIFSDISELFDPKAFRMLVRHYDDRSIGAVTGNHVYNVKETGLGSGTRFYWRFKRFLQRIESRIDTVCACDGTIYSCRRQLFPYPPDNTINDDVAVPLGIIRQGARVIFDPEAIIRGDPLPETERFFRQKVRSQAGKYQNFWQARSMFIPWPVHRWWIFISHTAMPVFVPWFLLLAFLTNLGLAVYGSFPYRLMFLGQCIFYGFAALGYLAERFNWHIQFLSIPFYFVTANLGSLFGFFAFALGRQRAAWRKLE